MGCQEAHLCRHTEAASGPLHSPQSLQTRPPQHLDGPLAQRLDLDLTDLSDYSHAGPTNTRTGKKSNMDQPPSV